MIKMWTFTIGITLISLLLPVAALAESRDTAVQQKLRIVSLNGNAEIWTKKTMKWAPLDDESPLCISCAVKIGDKSDIQISLEPAMSVALAEKSILNIENLMINKSKKAIRMLFRLQLGKMTFDIPEYLDFKILSTIETPTGTIFLHNGAISINVASDITTVDVMRGSAFIKHTMFQSKTVVYDRCRATIYPMQDAINITALQETVVSQASSQSEQAPRSMAILSIKSQNVANDNLETISDLVAQEIEKQSTTKVLFLNDVRSMLESEGLGKLLDCFTDSCISKIGNVIGVDKIVLGNLNKLGSKYLFNLKLVDVLHDKVESRVNTSVDDDVGLIINQIAPMINSMVKPMQPVSVASVRSRPAETVSTIRDNTGGTQPNVEQQNGYTNMVLIPGGSFPMGSMEGDGDNDEWPQHTVTLAPFYMDKYEVTKQDFEGMMGFNPSGFKGCQQCPVDNVTHHEALQFCEKKGKRLPTEAEWEYACRAGTQTVFSMGSTLSSAQANFNGTQPYGGAPMDLNRAKVMPVGNFTPNKFNLFDMHGNLWEWCNDWYSTGYYKISPAQNPRGPENGVYKVVRGGSWENGASSLRSANRVAYNPYVRLKTIGFRCVKSVDK